MARPTEELLKELSNIVCNKMCKLPPIDDTCKNCRVHQIINELIK